MRPVVPRLALWLLQRRVPSQLQEFVIGDLEEGFQELAIANGSAAARRWYWTQTISLAVRPWPLRRSEMESRPSRNSGFAAIGRDLRYGLRALRRAPLFASLVVLTFA